MLQREHDDPLLASGSELVGQNVHNKGPVCFIQEDIVEGEISLSKPFLKETKTNSLPRLKSEVLSI